MQAQLSKFLQKPGQHDFNILTGIMEDLKLKDDYLTDWEKHIWKHGNEAGDLVSITPVHDFDPFSSWLIKLLLMPYHEYIRCGQKETANLDANLYHYKDSHLEYPAYVISTGLASLLPIISIVVLYAVDNMGKRLGIIAAFTSIFAMSVAFMTGARRVDVFAATAAWVPMRNSQLKLS